MSWDPTLYSVLGVVAGTISTGVAAYAWRDRDDRTVVAFASLMVVLAVWSFVCAVQLGFRTADGQLLLQGLTLGVAGVVPTAWLIFTIYYTGYGTRLTDRWLAVLFVDPIAFLLLSLTNPIHGLVFEATGVTMTGYGPVVSLSFAVGYGIHITYAYAAVAAGLVVMTYVGVVAAPMYRTQVVLLIGGVMPPFLSHIAYTLGVSPIATLDLTPFLFAVTGVLFGLALIRYDLVDRRPVAQAFAIETAKNGLVVVDEDDRIVEVNEIAAAAFDPPPRVGQHASSFFDVADLTTLDGTFHEVRRAGDRRTYHVRVSRLGDHTDRSRGTAVTLREVTDLRAYEQRLEVSNRVLRHNLRTATNVISGYAGEIADRVDDPQAAADAARIEATAADLHELSEHARELVEDRRDATLDPTPVDLVAHTQELVTSLQETYPHCTVTVTAPDRAVATLPGAETYRKALWNLLDNAVEHNDADEPRIEVRIGADEDAIRVSVADNGPGVPDLERRVFETGSERPLQHSAGLGLWIAYLHTTEAGGDFEIDSSDDGTTVTMTYLA